jgi:hypothetical protein
VKNLLALVILSLSTANASACSLPLVPLDLQIDRAEQIFIATLLEAKVMRGDRLHKWPWIEGRFQIEKNLKGGPLPKDVTLITGMGRGDCGVGMMVSAKYIIFKGKNDTGIGEDTGTHIIEDFQDDELAAKIQSILHQQHIKLREN